MMRRRKTMLTLSSVTYAYKARDILFEKGIRGYVERVPQNLREEGCGYGISVYSDADRAEIILKEANITVKKRFEM